jgi:hypothetical protein
VTVVAAEAGCRLTQVDIKVLTTHPALEHQRLRFDTADLTQLIQEALAHRGQGAQLAGEVKWLWVGTDTGAPSLYLILPGAAA